MADILQAAGNGDVPRLRATLEAGGNVNEKIIIHKTKALHWAANYGHVDAMALLLDHGADVRATNIEGKTALHWAAHNGHVTAMALLLDRGADLNATDTYGCTALHLTAWYYHVSAMALLLDRGADLRATNNSGDTALHWAAEKGHVDGLTLLLDRGADVSVTNINGDTALHGAAERGRVDAAVLLLDCGADLSVTNKVGSTARMRCHREDVAQAIDSFVSNVSEEWRPSRHHLYPRPYRRAVDTVVALWSWNFTTSAPWHPGSPFTVLPLELLFEVFMWLAVDIARCGYVVVAPVTVRLAVHNEKRGEEEDGGPIGRGRDYKA